MDNRSNETWKMRRGDIHGGNRCDHLYPPSILSAPCHSNKSPSPLPSSSLHPLAMCICLCLKFRQSVKGYQCVFAAIFLPATNVRDNTQQIRGRRLRSRNRPLAANGANVVKEQSGLLATLDMSQNVPMGWMKANTVEHVPHGRSARKTQSPVGR